MAVLPLGFDPFCSMRIKIPAPSNPALVVTLLPVRFVDNCGPFKGGEVASFLPEDADALVAAGLARAA